MEFTGFNPQGLDLLIENRMMNSLEFYEEHKAQIKRLAIEPFYALCERMRDEMLLIDPLFVTVPPLSDHLSRPSVARRLKRPT